MSYRNYSFYARLVRRWRRKNGGTIRSTLLEPIRGYLDTDTDLSSTTGAKNNSGIWKLEEVHDAISNIVPVGEHAYTTPGTYTWVAPPGVTSVCILVVGAGGGTTGGALGYKNNRAVTPGTTYEVRAGLGGQSAGGGQGGSAGQSSYFRDVGGANDTTANGGPASSSGTTIAATRSGDTDGGGDGGRHTSNGGYAGTGAGGYSGNGGNYGSPGSSFQPGTGGGGASGQWAYNSGGGVGIYGEGPSGTSARAGGSGGANGGASANGGAFGGGAAANPPGNRGGAGAVRILWGEGRAFPSTKVDLASSNGNVETN